MFSLFRLFVFFVFSLFRLFAWRYFVFLSFRMASFRLALFRRQKTKRRHAKRQNNARQKDEKTICEKKQTKDATRKNDKIKFLNLHGVFSSFRAKILSLRVAGFVFSHGVILSFRTAFFRLFVFFAWRFYFIFIFLSFRLFARHLFPRKEEKTKGHKTATIPKSQNKRATLGWPAIKLLGA